MLACERWLRGSEPAAEVPGGDCCASGHNICNATRQGFWGVIHNVSLVHVLLAAAAAGSVYLAWREVRRRYISQWRLFAPPAFAMAAALGMILTQIGEHVPAWQFAAALGAGTAIGLLRGFTIRIEHDMYRPTLNIAHTAKLVLLWVSFAVAAAVAVEIVGAFVGPGLDQVRLWAALIASVCASAMLSRAVALTIRLHTYT